MTTPTPTPEAIEAAARALFERERQLTLWEWVVESDAVAAGMWRDRAAAALTAAYPFIAAQALRDAASDFAEGEWVDAFIHASDDIDAVKAVDKWLTERATELTP